jgi:hypothetical protein
MKTNFESAITSAIETVAGLLNRSIAEITAQSLNAGPVREMVITLTIAQAQ